MKALPWATCWAASAALVAALLFAGVANAATPPLVAAVKSGDRAAALDLARDKNAVLTAEADGTTALHWAVRGDDLELVDLLLRSGADASAANRYGVTPLHLAAINGNAVMIERLIKAGANPNSAGSDGETPLMTVARGGHVVVLSSAGPGLKACSRGVGLARSNSS